MHPRPLLNKYKLDQALRLLWVWDWDWVLWDWTKP